MHNSGPRRIWQLWQLLPSWISYLHFTLCMLAIPHAHIMTLTPWPCKICLKIQHYDYYLHKKVQLRTRDSSQTIHYVLRFALTSNKPQATLLRDAFTNLCLANSHSLHIFGNLHKFTLNIHPFLQNNYGKYTLGQKINSSNHQYHLTQFKIIKNIHIHPKFHCQHKLLTQQSFTFPTASPSTAIFPKDTATYNSLPYTILAEQHHISTRTLSLPPSSPIRKR